LPVPQFHWQQILDVLIVAVLFYYVFYFVRGTKTAIVIQGIFIVAAVYYICQLLRLLTLVWIFEKVLFVGSFALIIIFAPEIRQFLERAGRTRFLLRHIYSRPGPASKGEICDLVVSSMRSMSERRLGGLIAILGDDHSALEQMIIGVRLDSEISTELILTIFDPGTPLHDGAIVIDNGRILYAGCFFPLSEREQAIKFLGTRHHAGIGITERTDIIVAVVSEETGALSICHNGRISYNMTSDQVSSLLRLLISNDSEKASILPRILME